MRNNRPNMEIEEAIRASMKLTDVPASELNHKLKVTLYQLPRMRTQTLRRFTLIFPAARHKTVQRLSCGWYKKIWQNLSMLQIFPNRWNTL